MKNSYKTRIIVAYGSNLNIAELKRKWRVNLGNPIAKVVLPDRKLAFTCYSSGRRGGVLDIPPALGSYVEAVIFGCSDDEFAIICRKEGAKYIAREGWVYSLDGERYWATYFEVRPEHRQEFVAPSPYYLSVVNWGYEHFGLSTTTLQKAAHGPDTQQELPIFTYGTLMRGESRHAFLAPFISKAIVPCEMWGKLKTKWDYPMLVNHMKSRTLVPGEACLLANPERAFAVLDRVEGARSYTETEPGFYRTPVVVATQDKGWERVAWCYVWWGDLPKGARRVEGDSWREKAIAVVERVDTIN
jgi:gamma-glutamylcyclotransferase (GGCT)/AIG2-like uncharacterized protein YtfP